MTSAGDVYDRLREWEERGIPGRYHDHANTLPYWGGLEVNGSIGSLAGFKAALLFRGLGSNRIVRKSRKREADAATRSWLSFH